MSFHLWVIIFDSKRSKQSGLSHFQWRCQVSDLFPSLMVTSSWVLTSTLPHFLYREYCFQWYHTSSIVGIDFNITTLSPSWVLISMIPNFFSLLWCSVVAFLWLCLSVRHMYIEISSPSVPSVAFYAAWKDMRYMANQRLLTKKRHEPLPNYRLCKSKLILQYR